MQSFVSEDRDSQCFRSASALFFILACFLICVDVRVVTIVEIICQLLPYIENPSRNFSCSACVHFPLFWLTVKTCVLGDNED